MNMTNQQVMIVGGGPVGTLLALYLARRGITVELFEKREDPRQAQGLEGRSINLALSVRGLHALHEVGLDAQLLEHAVPMKGRLVHDKDLQEHFIPYSPKENQVIYSISRSELNKLLLECARQYKKIKVNFNHECQGVDLKNETITFLDKISKKQLKKPLQVVFDAEGIWSTLRPALLHQPYTNYTQEYLDFEYKELTIQSHLGDYQIEKNAFHLWPRGSHLMIALPNNDGSFTCTLFLPKQGDFSFNSLNNKEKANVFFKREFPDALKLMQDMEKQFLEYPVGRLATIKISPWTYRDKILLIGDAAHGIVPFYGQGLNCGFEDCSYLNACLEANPDWSWGEIFKTYEQGRKCSAYAIAELSFDNFVELREKMGDPVFRLKRELETLLEQQYPDSFLSKYSMVTFSRMPYEEALAKGRKQDKLLMEACRGVENISQIDLSPIKRQLDLE